MIRVILGEVNYYDNRNAPHGSYFKPISEFRLGKIEQKIDWSPKEYHGLTDCGFYFFGADGNERIKKDEFGNELVLYTVADASRILKKIKKDYNYDPSSIKCSNSYGYLRIKAAVSALHGIVDDKMTRYCGVTFYFTKGTP